MSKKTGCKNGNCNVLFNDSTICDYRRTGKYHICMFMHQSDGRCLHRIASARPKPPRGGRQNGATNNQFFKNQYSAWCEELKHNKKTSR